MPKNQSKKKPTKTRDQIFRMIPDLPQDIDRWIRDNPLRYSRYLFTWTQDGIRYGYCSDCGKTSTLSPSAMRTSTTEDYENYSKKHNDVGFCPNCKKTVTFKDRGRGRGKMYDEGYFTIAQRLKDKGIIIRSFFVLLDYSDDYKNVEIQYSEHYRVYFNSGIARAYKRSLDMGYYYSRLYYGCRVKDEYYSSDNSSGWCEMSKIPCVYSGVQNYRYFKNFYFAFDCKTFSKSNLQYSCIKDFMSLRRNDLDYEHNCTKCINVAQYLELYVKHPVLVERMMKQGFGPLIAERIEGNNKRLKMNWRAQTVEKAIELSKRDIREMPEKSKTTSGIIKQIFLNQLRDTTPENKKWISEHVDTNHNIALFQSIMAYTTPNKIVKYARTQKDFSLTEYRDYLDQCKRLNLQTDKDFILFPQNLHAAHQGNIKIENDLKEQEKIKQAKERDNKFKKRYKELCDRYEYQSDGLIITPATGSADLWREGKELNHCVGTYADRYLLGQTNILLIRKLDEPDKPYFTMEISNSDVIIQTRGLRNCPPTSEVEAFIKTWQHEIKKQKSRKNNQTNKTAKNAA